MDSLEHIVVLESKTVVMKDKGVQVSISEIPKRKPVPAPAGVDGPSAEAGPFAPIPSKSAWGSPLFVITSRLPYKGNRKRQVLLVAGIAGLVLVALIIGLAVGLSLRKRHSNLPLPTANGGPYSGDLTYYEPGLGSGGITSAASESICAVSRLLYDAVSVGSNPNANPLCGKMIRLRRGERSVDVKVVDRCVGCKATDIDVSMSVFTQLALVEQGRVNVEWAWLEKAPVAIP